MYIIILLQDAIMRLLVKFYFTLILTISSVNSFSGENSHYDFSWLDPDKEIFVLQNRTYKKDGNFYLNFGGGFTASGAFVDSLNIQGRFGFFFTEEMGIELLYSNNSGKENDTATAVRGNPGETGGSAPFRRIVDNYYGAYFLWSPFYAKVNTFNKIIYLDWILGLGYANMSETNNKNEVTTSGQNKLFTSESHHCLSWDIGLKFYLSSSFDIRIDLTALHYQTASALSLNSDEKNWYSHYDVSLSLGYKF